MNNSTANPYPPSDDSLQDEIEKLRRALRKAETRRTAAERKAARRHKAALRRPPRRPDAR